jgi:hypothetical protein
MRKPKISFGRVHRADYYFAVASIAFMVFLAGAGFGAWMLGNSRAAVDSPAQHSTATVAAVRVVK